MSQYMTRATAVLTLSVLFAACSGDKKNDTLAQDTSLNRDIQLANADTTSQPTLKDVPATTTPTPAPATTAPAPRPTTSTPRTSATTRPATTTTRTPTPTRTTTQPATG